ncbi:MAG: hypothetical protein V3T73_00065, partial [Dehalococcoidales bacterium]
MPFKGNRRVWHILKDGAKFGEWVPDVKVNMQIHPLIAFADGCDVVINKPVCALLGMIGRT